MGTLSKTPLWLDLKKEYIDDNFDKLLPYLKENEKNTQDSFYEQTLQLLHDRVKELIDTLAECPIYEEERDSEARTFNVKLLATYLLSKPHDDLVLPAFVAMTNELMSLTTKFYEELGKVTMSCLMHESITSLGISWSDVSGFMPDVFAFKLFTNITFGAERKKPLVYEEYGAAFLSSKGLFLTAENAEEGKKLLNSGTNSIETGNGCTLRTVSSLKLKKADENSLKAMDEYVKDFILSQWKSRKTPKRLPQFSDGDETLIEITKIDKDGTIHVRTVDQIHEPMNGTIKFEKASIVYYYTNSLYEFFRRGDCLKATVSSIANQTFNIEKQLIDFFVSDTQETYSFSDLMLAKLIDEKPNAYGWINERGVCVYTKNTGDYKKDDLAYLQVESYGKGNLYGKINARINSPADEGEELEEKEERYSCIRAFATALDNPEEKKDNDVCLNPLVLKLLYRQFFQYQKKLLKPSERFRYLMNALVMAEMVGDELSSSFIKFTATYLYALVQFVQSENLSSFKLEPEEAYKDAVPTLIRLSVLELLQEYGKKENSPVLAQTIEDYKDSIPMLSRLARLVQTANSMIGTLSDSSINVIKREIIKTLSLETEDDADLEADGSNYLGVESDTVEFKTSMVYPANNQMQPNQTAQTANVLRAVCAFLNSTNGGTLYLGVNDQGYVVGLDNDMKFLKCSSIDTYSRESVQDAIIAKMGLDAMTYIKIEPQFDNRVLALHVSPHPYRVVELNGVAYLRVNNESREMPENVKQEMIARKIFKDKNKAAAISQLQHAVFQKKCAVLHAYASSNSGNVKDRFVEPYCVYPDDSLVLCYDRDKFQCKFFNLSRIGYVEVKDEDWKYPASHEMIAVDAFHMTGKTAYKVSLQLDLLAKNQAIEEFPRLKDDISSSKGDENTWYLTTTVYAFEGIGRFYIGLANHIKILDAPELVEYVKTFKEKYL